MTIVQAKVFNDHEVNDGARPFAEYLKQRPAMQDQSGHVQLHGWLLSSNIENRFVLAATNTNRVFEGMSTDVVSYRHLDGPDEDLVEVVLPKNAIVREIRFHNASEVVSLSGPGVLPGQSPDPGYWNGAAWKESGYWNGAAWKESGYWNGAAWKESGYWNGAAWKESGYWNGTAWKDSSYWNGADAALAVEDTARRLLSGS